MLGKGPPATPPVEAGVDDARWCQLCCNLSCDELFSTPEEDLMQTAVRKLGNSAGVIIPKSILIELGLSAGDALDMRLQEGRLILAPVRPPRRAGWIEASRAIAASSDDFLVWPEFGNAGDADLTW
jgi:antitoxin MazE